MNPTTFQEYKDAISRDDAVRARRLLGVLVKEEMPLVRRCARKVANGDVDDLTQAGLIGLCRAIEKYEPHLGAFASYARQWIFSELRDVVTRRPQVQVRSRWEPMPKGVRRNAEIFTALTGREPTAADLHVDEDDWAAWNARPHFVEYRDPSDDEGAAGETAGAAAHMCKALQLSATQATEDLVLSKLSEHLAELPERTRQIVAARVVEGQEFKEIAATHGLSDERVRVICTRALEKLQLAIG